MIQLYKIVVATGVFYTIEVNQYQSYQSTALPEPPADVDHISAILDEVLKD